MRIFFATDIHGSDVCWRKFLNAGAFHKAEIDKWWPIIKAAGIKAE